MKIWKDFKKEKPKYFIKFEDSADTIIASVVNSEGDVDRYLFRISTNGVEFMPNADGPGTKALGIPTDENGHVIISGYPNDVDDDDDDEEDGDTDDDEEDW